MRVGVIGAGSMGQNHARLYAGLAELTGICDTDPSVGKPVAERFGTSFFPSHQALLDDEYSDEGSDRLRLRVDTDERRRRRRMSRWEYRQGLTRSLGGRGFLGRGVLRIRLLDTLDLSRQLGDLASELIPLARFHAHRSPPRG